MSGTVLILAEKPSAAKNFAAALGGMDGSYAGEPYRVFALAGHLLGFVEPHEMVSAPDLVERYRSWNPDNLPWSPEDLTWRKEPLGQRASETLRRLASALTGVAEVCIATDNDPTGEGELLAWEALDHAGWAGRTTRMYFEDEEAESVRSAFASRTALAGGSAGDADCRMADARSRFDYLSMQLTRAATGVGRTRGVRTVLRQGRLKTPMVSMVGDQEKAVKDYRRTPYYEVRYRDDAGHLFARAAAEKHASRQDAEAELSDTGYADAAVVVDGTERLAQTPPCLPDFAMLAADLAAKGCGQSQFQDTYQRMYDDHVLSYPRTGDRAVTPEQFEALLPLAGRIAALAGVDAALLTHTEPRPTHVRGGMAHGANRPATNVPDTIGDLDRYGDFAADIYRLVATSWLATLCEDRVYDRVSAHIEGHDDFTAKVDLTVDRGWQTVLPPDETPGTPFGTVATPHVHEGANRRPQQPTVRWLQRRLERYDVGTGATRVSVLADALSGGPKALLAESRGRLSLTGCGRVSYALTRGCAIASPDTTEKLHKMMRGVQSAEVGVDEVCAAVAPLVAADLETMRANAEDVPMCAEQDIGPCPRCGKPVTRRGSSVQCSSNRNERRGGKWVRTAGCGWTMGTATVRHKRLTTKQVARLLAGETVTLSLTRRDGKPYKMSVRASATAEYGCEKVRGAADGGRSEKGEAH